MGKAGVKLVLRNIFPGRGRDELCPGVRRSKEGEHGMGGGQDRARLVPGQGQTSQHRPG